MKQIRNQRNVASEHSVQPKNDDSPVNEFAARPSEPGFVLAEARELLGMSEVANYLGPVVFPPLPVGLQPSRDPDDPLPNDDGRTYPYPAERMWPRGWVPGVKSRDSRQPWADSVLISRLPSGAGVNSAIFCRHPERQVYAVAFSGTLNPGAVMQDVASVLIPAGPVNLPYFKSEQTYIDSFPDLPEPATGGVAEPPPVQPPGQIPRVHLGYRDAVESLSVRPLEPYNLRSIITGIDAEEIELYVTGHSLGGAVAQLFSAWLNAGCIPAKKIHVKCYSFASPKCANLPMASNYAMALGNAGFSFNIYNSLDTAPQLPPTRETSADSINPAISADLGSKAKPDGNYACSPLSPVVEAILGQPGGPGDESPEIFSHASVMNFCGLGVPHVLMARQPVVYDGRFYPPEFFPARHPQDLVAIPDETTRVWWQHYPFSYAKYLSLSEQRRH